MARRQKAVACDGADAPRRAIEDRRRIHPAVAGVCVIGVPEASFGERVCAYAVPLAGPVVMGACDTHASRATRKATRLRAPWRGFALDRERAMAGRREPEERTAHGPIF